MIEKIVINYLTEKLAGIPVYMEEPEKPPKEYVLVEKVGGSERNLVQTAQITVCSYSTSLLKTAQLNDVVKAKMRKMIELDEISSCGLNSDYNYTDTDTRRYRYQALFNIVYTETE